MSEDDSRANRSDDRWTDYITPKTIIIAVIAVAALLFVFQNTNTGHFHFLFADFRAPTWLWLLGMFAVGFAAGFLVARRRARASKPKAD